MRGDFLINKPGDKDNRRTFENISIEIGSEIIPALDVNDSRDNKNSKSNPKKNPIEDDLDTFYPI